MSPTQLHLLFFASGAVGLVYEVLWMRRFTVLFGATAPASAATLSALFLGLGLGSALIGARCARFKRPLLAFGLLEAGVALGALLVEPALAVVEAVTPHLGLALSDRPVALLASRMLLAALAILPPALFMGGTLPVLAQAVAGSRGRLGVKAGGLYAMNTLGAALGSIAVPTVLLPQLGARGALGVAISGSLAIAAVSVSAAAPDGTAAPPTEPVGAIRPSLLAASFFSGAIALGLEVLWTRMLALVHENSAYSFATVLAVYLAGTGIGAGLARRLLARGWRSATLIGAGWIGAGLWVAISPDLFYLLTSGLDYVSSASGLFRHELRIAGLALVTLFPSTVLAGVALPALMERAGGAGGIAAGPVLGRLLFANTLGAIAGPLAALFVVGPTLGLWSGMAAAGVLLAFAGGIALHRPVMSCVPVVLLVLLLQPGSLPRARITGGERLIALREGAFGTVAVVEDEGHRRMQLNNHYVLGGTASTGEERLQAHIPLLLHRAPGSVAFLGLGTGITASAALFHPVREVVLMELVPEVVTMARDHFREANLRVLEDPRVRTVTDDARSHLRLARGAFDVIVGDLVVPWRRGESSLYTLESFESARQALAPGGIYCQWVPLFQLSEREFTIIAATFLDVFPEAVLWRGDFRAGEPAVALVGLTGSEPLDPAAIDERVTEYARAGDPANPYLADPAGLWAYLAGPLSAQDPLLREAPRSRDRWPIVELLSPAVDPDSAFTAERLKPFLTSLLARPLGGTPLEKLDSVHLGWQQAGARIWEASLLALRGREAEADALGLDALSALPEPLRRAVLGPAVP